MYFLKDNFHDFRERFVDFLATCLQLDPNFDHDIAVELRPYGGIIGIESSSLDNYFNFFVILILHDLLHEAASFVHEFRENKPGYSYIKLRPVTNKYPGHVTELAFCLHWKTLKGRLFGLLEC